MDDIFNSLFYACTNFKYWNGFVLRRPKGLCMCYQIHEKSLTINVHRQSKEGSRQCFVTSSRQIRHRTTDPWLENWTVAHAINQSSRSPSAQGVRIFCFLVHKLVSCWTIICDKYCVGISVVNQMVSILIFMRVSWTSVHTTQKGMSMQPH